MEGALIHLLNFQENKRYVKLVMWILLKIDSSNISMHY